MSANRRLERTHPRAELQYMVMDEVEPGLEGLDVGR